MYLRFSKYTFFLLPGLAVGVEPDGAFFMELAWFNVAIGIGWLNES